VTNGYCRHLIGASPWTDNVVSWLAMRAARCPTRVSISGGLNDHRTRPGAGQVVHQTVRAHRVDAGKVARERRQVAGLGDLRLRFERFLRFAETVSLPADLTERHFRALWAQTDKNTREEELRFRQVVKLLCPKYVASPYGAGSRRHLDERFSAPEVLKPIRSQLGVTHRVLDVLVAEPSL